jgi:hypothetical protein
MLFRLCVAALLLGACTHPDCRLIVQPVEHDFGGVAWGSSKLLALRLYNAGTTDCRVQPSLASTAFSVSGGVLDLHPEETQLIDVSYTPGSASAIDAATLRLDADTSVLLRGRALPAPACTDGLMNGDETGIDCGGSCPYACGGPPCYAARECSSGVCSGPQAIPPAVDWSDPASDVAWAPADLVGGFAALYNDHVDLRVRFRDTPFDPSRPQVLTFCLDTDEDAATGQACGGALPGADIAIAFRDGELQTHDQIGDACSSDSYDEATKTLHLAFENGRFPRGYLEEQFRYIVLSTTTDNAGQTVTDSAPDAPDFRRPEGAFSSHHVIALWQANGACCRFQAGACVGGSCQPPRCQDGVRNGDESGVDCGGSCPRTCSPP